jgi:hypothetical protein
MVFAAIAAHKRCDWTPQIFWTRSGKWGVCPSRARSNIYNSPGCWTACRHSHHAFSKALLYPARRHPICYSGIPRPSFRPPSPLGSCSPELTLTRTQCHVGAELQKGGLLYQYHFGRKRVRRHDRHGQVGSHPRSMYSPNSLQNPSSDLWVAGSVPNAKDTGANATVNYAVGSAGGARVFFMPSDHGFDASKVR